MALLDDFKARRPQLRDVDHFHTAMMLSVVLHLSIALVWALNQQFKFLHPDLFKFLEQIDPTRVLVEKKPKEAVIIDSRLQRMIEFKLAEVDPSQASVVVPQDAKFYGAHNSIAANEKPTEKDTGKARIEGDQTKLIRTKDSARPLNKPPTPPPAPEPKPQPENPPPAPKPEPKPAAAKPEPKPESKPDPPKPPLPQVVQVAKAILPKAAPPEPKTEPQPEKKPEPKPVPLAPTPPEPRKPDRPRTLAEARQREAERLKLLGKQMKQDGGVRRRGGPTLSVMGTSFGAYDTKLANLIQNAWHLLLEGRVSPVGKVVVKFRLLADGRVTDVEIAETTVDDLFTTICQMSVNGPKFDRWPPEMRRQLQNDYRDHTITFYYH